MDPLVTRDQLVFLHVVASDIGHGQQAITRDDVDEALGRPVATFVGELLYGTPFARAAALMESLIARRHRALAVMAGALWLEREGYRLEASPAELRQQAMAVAAGAEDVDGLAGWFDANCRPLR